MIDDREQYEVGFLTQDDIKDVREAVRIGDYITLRKSTSYTSFTGESINSVIRGKVIGKYPNYAILRTANGYNETVQWIDILLFRKRMQEKEAENGN